VFVAATPFVVLDARTALADLRFEGRHMVLGHLGREEGRALLYYLKEAIPRGWTPVVAVGAVAGIIALLVRPASRREAVVGAVFALTLLAVMGGWRMAAPRYMLPLLPLTAAWAAALPAALTARFRPRAGRAVSLGLAALLLVVPLAALREDLGRSARPDSRSTALAWIREHVPAGSALLMERAGPEPDPDRYLVLYLPFHAVTPHIYDGAYSVPLYATFDLVVLSSAVSGRFLARPRDYPAQASFYDGLARGFEEAAVFEAGEYAGPTIRILRRREDPRLRDVSDIPLSFFDTHRGNVALAEHLSALGTLLVRQHHAEPGFLLLERAVEMAEGSARVWANLGSMRTASGDYSEAVLAFRRAEELDPRDARIALAQGALFDRMGEHRQAGDAYRRAAALDPSAEEALWGLARSLVADDRFGAARSVLQEFLERFPRSARRAAVEAALAELRHMGPGKP
jgi:tetratricopeptide (TPR) repeat protein